MLTLGLLVLLPLFMLSCLERGAAAALRETGRSILHLSPLFFLFGLQTKAFYFDAALGACSQPYLATGRTLALGHVRSHDVFRATAHSHVYLGLELALLLGVTAARGAWESAAVGAYLGVSTWLYALACLAAPALFNPESLELSVLAGDASAWAAWMGAPPAGEPSGAASWADWHEASAARRYAGASLWLRAARAARSCRLLAGAGLILAGAPGADVPRAALWMGGCLAGSYAGAGALAGGVAGARAAGACARARAGAPPQPRPPPSGLAAAALAAAPPALPLPAVCAGAALGARAGDGAGEALLSAAAGLLAASACARLVYILPLGPLAACLAPGARASCALLDALAGGCQLALAAAAALALPAARALHASLLFGARYADALAGGGAALRRTAPADDPLAQLPQAREMELGAHAQAPGALAEPPFHWGAGARRFRVKPLPQLQRAGTAPPHAQQPPPASPGPKAEAP